MWTRPGATSSQPATAWTIASFALPSTARSRTATTTSPARREIPATRAPGLATISRRALPARVSLATRQNRLNLPLGERAPDEINVIVEIPSGSRNKYEYDKSLDIFRLDRALHSPIFYPGDYGFVPRTLATSTTGWDDAATARRVITESAQRFDGTA